jgi:hypothetical protein
MKNLAKQFGRRAVSERDIVERLRGDGVGSQNCPLCWQSGFVLDSVKFTRCGRGDCAQEEAARTEAAAEILRLRAELATARRDGWIAGRDAAADFMSDLGEPAYAEGIRQLEQIT